VLAFFALGGYAASAGTTYSDFLIYVLIALSALAMGLQTVGVQALGIKGIATTYITGTWTSLVTTLTQKSGAKNNDKTMRPVLRDNTRVQALVLSFYVIAAILSGLAVRTVFLKASIIPVVTVALVIFGARKYFHRPTVQN
jgi:uncharacterized membrane protein YoaK (UPF0700 family)